MSLAPGTRLGPYEVIAPLGVGGMGEVYRARDPRLGREVALKVLPPEFAQDDERRARFEQEVRAASALNHPNVVHVYDVGSENGNPFLAMELVDGRTLRDSLSAGPLAPRKVLELAVQIADGLARAHEAGIVHRDLKPENVMVAKDGHVRILDFGLAKLTEPKGDFAEASTSPQMTRSGMAVGTVGYMSPEQAAGKPVDFRSDQFAFGSIVYEMASGQRAFSRKTGPETLTAILREQPEPLAERAPRLPAPLRWIVEERCLAKEPEERYASTRDLLRELQGLRDHISEMGRSGEVEVLGRLPRRVGRGAAALLGLALLAAGLVAGRWLAPRTAAEPPAFQRLTFRKGSVENARFAPDGQTILYTSTIEGRPWEIFSTRLDSPESRPLGLPTARLLAVSRAGELAVILRPRRWGWESSGLLARLSLAGGAPRELLDDVEEADWTPDGQGLLVVRDLAGRRRLEYPIDTVLYQTAGFISSPRFSPRGDLIAFVDHDVRGDSAGRLAVVDLSGKKRDLAAPMSVADVLAWKSDEEIWVSGSRGSRLEIRAAGLDGQERLVWREAGEIQLHDISRDGRVLVTRISRAREIAGRARGASREVSLSWLDWSFPIDLTEDGTKLVFDEQGDGAGAGQFQVYVRPIDGSPALRLGEGRGLGLSPDGQTVVGANDAGFLFLPMGAGQPRALAAPGLAIQRAQWFPDGRRLLVLGHEAGQGGRFWVVDAHSGERRALTPADRPLNRGADFPLSPDGAHFVAREPDRSLSLYPVEGGDPRPIPGASPGDRIIQWTRDGRGVFVIGAAQLPTRVEILDLASGRRRLFKELTPADPAGVSDISPIRLARDGEAYIYSFMRSLSDLYLGEGLR